MDGIDVIEQHCGKDTVDKLIAGDDIADTLEGDQVLWDKLYELYLPDMPYGTAKARDGDPGEFITDQLEYEVQRAQALKENQRGT